jgi:hypothetical protein
MFEKRNVPECSGMFWNVPVMKRFITSSPPYKKNRGVPKSWSGIELTRVLKVMVFRFQKRGQRSKRGKKTQRQTTKGAEERERGKKNQKGKTGNNTRRKKKTNNKGKGERLNRGGVKRQGVHRYDRGAGEECLREGDCVTERPEYSCSSLISINVLLLFLFKLCDRVGRHS